MNAPTAPPILKQVLSGGSRVRILAGGIPEGAYLSKQPVILSAVGVALAERDLLLNTQVGGSA
jgi:hypothetical protein